MNRQNENKISTKIPVPLDFAHRFCRTPHNTKFWLSFISWEMITENLFANANNLQKGQRIVRKYENFSKDNPDSGTKYRVTIYDKLMVFENLTNPNYACEYHFKKLSDNLTRITYIEYNIDGSALSEQDKFPKKFIQKNLKKVMLEAYGQEMELKKHLLKCFPYSNLQISCYA